MIHQLKLRLVGRSEDRQPRHYPSYAQKHLTARTRPSPLFFSSLLRPNPNAGKSASSASYSVELQQNRPLNFTSPGFLRFSYIRSSSSIEGRYQSLLPQPRQSTHNFAVYAPSPYAATIFAVFSFPLPGPAAFAPVSSSSSFSLFQRMR